MQLTTLVLSFFLFLAGIGGAKIRGRLRENDSRVELLEEFRLRLSAFVESQGQDGEAYGWMLQRSERLQRAMGWYGVMPLYRPAFENAGYRNYQIVMNLVPKIRADFVASAGMLSSRGLGGLAPERQHHALLEEAFLRYAGHLGEKHEHDVADMVNPFKWLREGVQSVLLFPFKLLQWFGVLSPGLLEAIDANPFVKIVSGIVAIVSFLGSLTTVVVRWAPFSKIVHEWIAHTFPR